MRASPGRTQARPAVSRRHARAFALPDSRGAGARRSSRRPLHRAAQLDQHRQQRRATAPLVPRPGAAQVRRAMLQHQLVGMALHPHDDDGPTRHDVEAYAWPAPRAIGDHTSQTRQRRTATTNAGGSTDAHRQLRRACHGQSFNGSCGWRGVFNACSSARACATCSGVTPWVNALEICSTAASIAARSEGLSGHGVSRARAVPTDAPPALVRSGNRRTAARRAADACR